MTPEHQAPLSSDPNDAPTLMTSSPAATVQQRPSSCCGGPPKSTLDACCLKDEEAKATGAAGCGCQDAQRTRSTSAQETILRIADHAQRDRNLTQPANELPNVLTDLFQIPSSAELSYTARSGHPPRILLLYGSVRQRSYSRLLAEEAARLLNAMGAETRFFNPSGLPLPDDAPDTHPKVRELRELAQWSEGMVWSSPERHGAMSAIMKAQIDWIPLSSGAVRPTQGKTLAVMQVSGGSQSFNAVSQMRVLGRWMRMLTIPNQSSVPKAFNEFDEAGRMRPSALYDRVVDVMEELVKFTLLTRDVAPYLVDRYSERKESVEQLMKRVRQASL